MTKAWRNIGLVAEELKNAVEKSGKKDVEFTYVQVLNLVERTCKIGTQTAKDYITQMIRQGILEGTRGNRMFTLKNDLTDEQIQNMKES